MEQVCYIKLKIINNASTIAIWMDSVSKITHVNAMII